jgi:hypothetical protein
VLVSKQETSQFYTCPDIADGNPWMMYATAGMMPHDGAPLILLDNAITMAVSGVHGAMSRVPWIAARYTENSEDRRNGVLARAYARLAFDEVVDEAKSLNLVAPARWTATQEHPVMGADEETLDTLGITNVDLVVADSYPKESAVNAVNRLERATMYVWNVDAYEDLLDRGVSVELIRPTLVEGITGSSELPSDGYDVAVKTSGSGMKTAWTSALVGALTDVRRARSGQDSAFDWMLYTPGQRYSSDIVRPESVVSNRMQRLRGFCGGIGLNTSVVIGFPTELTAVVTEARLAGAPTQLLACPPRGNHELNNMKFAQKHGLLLGEIDFSGKHEPSLPGVRRVPISELGQVIDEAIADRPRALHPGLVGASDYVHHHTVAIAR